MRKTLTYRPVMGTKKLTPQELAEYVSADLMSGVTKEEAQGMYRMVYLINNICSRGGNEDVREATENLLYHLEKLI